MIGFGAATAQQTRLTLESIAEAPETLKPRRSKHGRRGRPTQPKGGRKGRGYRAHGPRGHRYAAALAGQRRPMRPQVVDLDDVRLYGPADSGMDRSRSS